MNEEDECGYISSHLIHLMFIYLFIELFMYVWSMSPKNTLFFTSYVRGIVVLRKRTDFFPLLR
ncbi:hypothetical protein I7I53_00298 [Histoplasma capsulatum var. duboisii H88]|uniref:Uncharacterized protein n=1 Tax=Ajellomyces capsulatus (strain H88) TaxID=544711 RepID=A0A8A1LJJ2_AJEC8|nr:hypothetical protein I7I53_00298 [Histoplasma capsulatum var. duboisii H88]